MAEPFDSENFVSLSGLCLGRPRAIHHLAYGNCYSCRMLVYRVTSKRNGKGYAYSRVPLIMPAGVGEQMAATLQTDSHIRVRAEVRVSYNSDNPVIELIVLGYTMLEPSQMKVADIIKGGSDDAE